MNIKVPFNDLKSLHLNLKDQIDEVIKDVIDKSLFIRGKYVNEFEELFAKAIGSNNCISVANGTDALYK